MDDLKLCPGPRDIAWTPGVSTAKSLCASTVAFRPGSDVGDVTPDPSVDVSAWEETSVLRPDSDFVNDLDKPIDLTGHMLSPFYPREFNYQDCRFSSVAHLMCYRYAVLHGLRSFAIDRLSDITIRHGGMAVAVLFSTSGHIQSLVFDGQCS